MPELRSVQSAATDRDRDLSSTSTLAAPLPRSSWESRPWSTRSSAKHLAPEDIDFSFGSAEVGAKRRYVQAHSRCTRL